MRDFEKEEIRDMILEEGMEYTFIENNNYEDTGDEVFIKLVRNYLKASEKIKNYLDMEY